MNAPTAVPSRRAASRSANGISTSAARRQWPRPTSASSSGPPTLPGTTRRPGPSASRQSATPGAIGPTTRATARTEPVAGGDGRGDAALGDHDARGDEPRNARQRAGDALLARGVDESRVALALRRDDGEPGRRRCARARHGEIRSTSASAPSPARARTSRRHARPGCRARALELRSGGRDERAADDEHAPLTAGSGALCGEPSR